MSTSERDATTCGPGRRESADGVETGGATDSGGTLGSFRGRGLGAVASALLALVGALGGSALGAVIGADQARSDSRADIYFQALGELGEGRRSASRLGAVYLVEQAMVEDPAKYRERTCGTLIGFVEDTVPQKDARYKDLQKRLATPSAQYVGDQLMSLRTRVARDTQAGLDVLSRHCAEYLQETANPLDLSDADLTLAPMAGLELPRVRLDRADLYRADFTDAHLPGVSLRKTSMRGTSFRGADLTKAQVSPVGDVQGPTSFAGTDLRGADLTGADLRYVTTAEATCDGDTRMSPEALRGCPGVPDRQETFGVGSGWLRSTHR